MGTPPGAKDAVGGLGGGVSTLYSGSAGCAQVCVPWSSSSSSIVASDGDVVSTEKRRKTTGDVVVGAIFELRKDKKGPAQSQRLNWKTKAGREEDERSPGEQTLQVLSQRALVKYNGLHEERLAK